MKANELTSTHPFWNISVDETTSILDTDVSVGLSREEAEHRLKVYGRNSIKSSKESSQTEIFLRQFTSPLIMILIVAMAVTVAISHYKDAIFIGIAVVVNSLLGFYQENKAERALASLKGYLKQKSRVIRNGTEQEIDTEEIVIGDLIRLSQGDRVPADARLIFVNDFQVNESVLTGESLPTIKSIGANKTDSGLGDQTSMVFAGTLATQGVASALVCRTDNHTEFGKIATLIASTEHEKTPLQKAISKFSARSSIVLTGFTFFVFALGISAGYSGLDMFLTSVAIAVSAIPEGLPVALTVILSVGVQRMARRKGVVRKLIAAETLGSTTIILTDKTGTLTVANMELTEVISLNSTPEQRLIERALTNTDVLIENPDDKVESWRMNGRIMEVALVRGASMRGITLKQALNIDKIIQTSPFNAVRKFSATLINEEGRHMLVLFGAPDILLKHATITDDQRKHLHSQIDSLASKGSRVLGVAHKEIQVIDDFSISNDLDLSGISMDGLFVFHDPVRKEIKDAIHKVSQAGIKTVIMTGDHRGTAEAVAREVGMELVSGSVLDASEIGNMLEEDLKERLRSVKVISRVTPLDKLRIAKLYQESGEIVAMTGDGVNDAPSIKQANVGIAMGSGTEVARSVADLVLLDDNFETIVAAVEEGRQIMGNVRKVLVYLLSNVADGLLLIGSSLILGVPLPLNALQILWVNFFSDSFPAIAFAFERESNVLAHKPRRFNGSLFDPLMKFLIWTIGISTSIILFALYWFLLRVGYDETLVKTFIFAAFGTYTLFAALSVRSLDKSVLSYSFFSNWYLLGGISIGIVLMLIAVYMPLFQDLFGTVSLPLSWAMAVFVLGILNLLLIEVGKWIFRLNIQKA